MVGVIGVWYILAAAIAPTYFLSYGAAVVTTLLTGATIAQQMSQAAKELQADVLTAFRALYQRRLAAQLESRSHRVKMATGAPLTPRAANGAPLTPRAANGASPDAFSPEGKIKPELLGPEHIFQMVRRASLETRSFLHLRILKDRRSRLRGVSSTFLTTT